MKKRRKKIRKEKDIFDFETPRIEISPFDFNATTSRKTRKKNKRNEIMENIFGLDFSIPSLDTGFPAQKKIDPNRIPKPKLIGILSRQLSINQVYQALIRLGKHRLADEFLSEVEFVNKKYDKMLMEIEGDVEENVGNKILSVVVDEIISHMKRLYSMSFKPENEIDFHKQIESFLNGLIYVFEKSLVKFGWKVNVNREYRLPSNERIDLLISLGSARIGIEVKYDLKETSKLQTLLGQIDRYIPYLDSLIVISYNPLSPNAINAIKSKEIEKGKLIRIVTPNKII